MVFRYIFRNKQKFAIVASVYVIVRDPTCFDYLERNVFLPTTRFLPTEIAHKCALWSIRLRLPPNNEHFKPPNLKTSVFGINFDNPIGLAAGFDKDCEAIRGCQRLGFGFIEVGSVTPKPQEGNPKPRLFRLDEDNAVINRFGFPSKGIDHAERRLTSWMSIRIEHNFTSAQEAEKMSQELLELEKPAHDSIDYRHPRKIALHEEKEKADSAFSFQLNVGYYGMKLLDYLVDLTQPSSCKLGINMGINKTTKSPVNDYALGITRLGPYSDYVVINVSSPNTPGLRDLQRKNKLEKLLLHVSRCVSRVQKQGQGDACKALLLKISPDLSDEHLQDILELVVDPKYRVDGLIVSNTTMSRPETLNNAHKVETGGLSGLPVREKSTEMIRKVYRITRGTVPIVGVGGISTAEDAYEKIKAGASLVQLYTGLVYNGTGSIRRMKEKLSELVELDGYSSVSQAVGIETPLPAAAVITESDEH